jgi:signal recognition particle GTPase
MFTLVERLRRVHSMLETERTLLENLFKKSGKKISSGSGISFLDVSAIVTKNQNVGVDVR